MRYDNVAAAGALVLVLVAVHSAEDLKSAFNQGSSEPQASETQAKILDRATPPFGDMSYHLEYADPRTNIVPSDIATCSHDFGGSLTLIHDGAGAGVVTSSNTTDLEVNIGDRTCTITDSRAPKSLVYHLK